jgi:NAD(P)-dependent dehydrogenase (short-subunit alcohol dehydrogenase family)
VAEEIEQECIVQSCPLELGPQGDFCVGMSAGDIEGEAPPRWRQTSLRSLQSMVGRTETELGPVTILVNNAGVAWQGTLDTYDREQVARMRQVNVEGMIHATRAVMGGMRARRYGRIVNVSSIAAIGTALPLARPIPTRRARSRPRGRSDRSGG